MANTYTLIASSTVGSGGAANIQFTSIPATYTDLKVVISSRDSFTGGTYNELTISVNGSPTYARKTIYGIGSTPGSGGDSTGNFVFSNSSTTTANTFSNSELYIPNYTSSSVKSVSAESVVENNSATNNLMIFVAGSISLTSAITSITFTPNSSATLAQYSTAYLYGISKS
jgi:hypothetical protein